MSRRINKQYDVNLAMPSAMSDSLSMYEELGQINKLVLDCYKVIEKLDDSITKVNQFADSVTVIEEAITDLEGNFDKNPDFLDSELMPIITEIQTGRVYNIVTICFNISGEFGFSRGDEIAHIKSGYTVHPLVKTETLDGNFVIGTDGKILANKTLGSQPSYTCQLLFQIDNTRR